VLLYFNHHRNVGASQNRENSGPLPVSIQRFLISSTLLGVPSLGLAFLLSLIAPLQLSWAQAVDSDQTTPGNLKQLSLEQLGDVEVTTASKEPVKVRQTPAAIYVITQDRSAWTFYAGNGNWSTQMSDAVSVFNHANILSISWNAFLQRYLAVYTPPFSQNVVMRSSMNPAGPWSREIVAFVAMQPTSGNVYDALAHVEYDSNGGQTIYVSYSRSTLAPFSSEVRLVAVQFK
jgi:hypothetical protein